jgi:hypothetical protein
MISPQPNANAIFGLSKCEKVKSYITSEERIGFAAWQAFDSDRKAVLNKLTDPTYDESTYLGTLELVVLQSDLKLYKYAQNYPSCFPAKNLADWRVKINDIEGTISIMQKYIAGPSYKFKPITRSLFQSEYPKYFSLYGKKLSG